MQVFTDDLDVGSLAREVGLGVLGNLLSVRIVLVDQVDLLDLGLVFHECGQRFHFHGGVSIQAEMPVIALAVGQVGIDRRVIQVNNFLARIALVVLRQCVHDRQRRAGTVALNDITCTLVNRGLQGICGFLWAQFVVDADDLKLHAGLVLFAELVSHELKALELVRTHRGHQARQRVKPCNLDGLVQVDGSWHSSRCCSFGRCSGRRLGRRLGQRHAGVQHGRGGHGDAEMAAHKKSLSAHSLSPVY
ncbi:hypothetical protein D9M73_108010 [compost metagenome]